MEDSELRSVANRVSAEVRPHAGFEADRCAYKGELVDGDAAKLPALDLGERREVHANGLRGRSQAQPTRATSCPDLRSHRAFDRAGYRQRPVTSALGRRHHRIVTATTHLPLIEALSFRPPD
jgi:hypothetical protein